MAESVVPCPTHSFPVDPVTGACGVCVYEREYPGEEPICRRHGWPKQPGADGCVECVRIRQDPQAVREQLAAHAHGVWSSWVHWMVVLVGEEQPDGSVSIPKHIVEQWKRHADTPYDALSETLKNANRDEADRIRGITGHGN